MVKTEKGYYHVYHCISKEEIMEDEKFKDWIDDAPKNTVRQYLAHMLRYIDFRFKDEADRNQKNKIYVEVPVMTPTMLYEEAERDRLSGVNPSDYTFTRRLKDFRAYLINSDGRRTGLPLSQNTIKAAYEGICAFYSHHNFMVDKKTRQIKNEDFKDRETQIQTNADYKVTPDDMIQVLDNAELRDKAIVLVQASTGLSNSDVIQLTVGDSLKVNMNLV
jgi:integrase